MMAETAAFSVQLFLLMIPLMIFIAVLSRLFEGVGYIEELDRRYDRRPDRLRQPDSNEDDHRNDVHLAERQKQYRVNQYGEIFEETDD